MFWVVGGVPPHPPSRENPAHLESPPPLLFLLPCFFGWMSDCPTFPHISCVIFLNDIMNLHISTLGTLVPEWPCCVFYETMHQIYWGLTHNVFFWLYSGCIHVYHTSKDKERHSTLRLIDWHNHINIY